MSSAPIIVRPLTSPAEYQLYFRMADNAFSLHPSDEGAQSWQRFIMGAPTFRAEQVRNAFRNDQQSGGYFLHERLLRMGSARISTGCIGAVVTFAEHRNWGIASALMHDAIDFARRSGHALLLLDGIPKFYYRYGYTDIYDVSALEVDRSSILAQKPHQYHIREAVPGDAEAVLALYNRYYGHYTGSFERTLETEEFLLRQGRLKPVVAEAEHGTIEGYLYHGNEDDRANGREIAATNWHALHALMHYHASLFDESDAPRTLHYILSPDSLLAQWMIDHLEMPDTTHWRDAAQEWGIRGLSYHHRHTGWMARIVHLPALMSAILPELQARWKRSLARWTGEVVFTVGEEAFGLRIYETEVQLVDVPSATSSHVTLSPQHFAQLVFGYRPLSYFVHTRSLAGELGTVLAILFPPGHTWIPGTDWF